MYISGSESKFHFGMDVMKMTLFLLKQSKLNGFHGKFGASCNWISAFNNFDWFDSHMVSMNKSCVFCIMIFSNLLID